MGENSKIEWTHHTFNPWWGCAKVSPGCANCYAEAFAKRTGMASWGIETPRRFFGDNHWNEPLRWDKAALKAGKRHRVFCASMADVFDPHVSLLPYRHRLFDLMRKTPNLDWLLLTKRPKVAETWVSESRFPQKRLPANAWFGVSVEDQERANERIPYLWDIPASVRFLSCEPLLGPVDLFALGDTDGKYEPRIPTCIDWVIVGGESGPKSRPMNPEWARSLRDQCREAGIPFFFKQWGGRDKKAAGRLLDGETHDAIPTANVSGQQCDEEA